MSDTSPTHEDFMAQVRQSFFFLTSDYGFAEATTEAAPRGESFHLRYENATTAVLIEGQSWGTAATVYVGEKNARLGGDFELVPLWTLARLKEPERENALHARGQLAQVEANAAALRELAEQSLQGSFSAIEAGRAYLRARVQATRSR